MNRIAAIGSVFALAVASHADAAAARRYDVAIDQLKFGSVPAQLKVGDTIQWTNRDLFRHSVTARNAAFDLDLPPGKSGTIVLRHAGVVRFFCKYHPGMTGVLTVKP